MKKGVTFCKCNTILTFMCDIVVYSYFIYHPIRREDDRQRQNVEYHWNLIKILNNTSMALSEPLSLYIIYLWILIYSPLPEYIYIPPIPSSTWIYLWIHPYTLPLPEYIYGSSYTLLYLNISMDPPILSSTWIHL